MREESFESLPGLFTCWLKEATSSPPGKRQSHMWAPLQVAQFPKSTLCSTACLTLPQHRHLHSNVLNPKY